MQTDLTALTTFPDVSNTEILAKKTSSGCKKLSASLQHLETNYNVKHFFEFMVCMHRHFCMVSENSRIISIQGGTKSSETQTHKMIEIFYCFGKSQT